MRSLKKTADLANRFEYKLAKYAQEMGGSAIPLEAPKVSQSGTTELFFDSVDKQREFSAAIQKEGGLVYKVLLNAFNKSGGTSLVSFDLKIDAVPNQGATWVLSATPTALKSAVINALNVEYQKLMGQSMSARLKSADAKAKGGAGSGTLNVGALDLAP